MTTVLILVILALIWAAVLVPPYLQNRRETRPGDSITSFRAQLAVLERTTPGARPSNVSRLDVGRYAPPSYAVLAARHSTPRPQLSRSQASARRTEVRRRRRDVFLTLLGAVVVTLVLALVLRQPSVWMIQLIVDAAFGGYVMMLIGVQQQAVEKDEKVRYLRPSPQAPRVTEAQLLLRRSGS